MEMKPGCQRTDTGGGGGPKARIHASLGQRPRSAHVVGMRAESPCHLCAAADLGAAVEILGLAAIPAAIRARWKVKAGM